MIWTAALWDSITQISGESARAIAVSIYLSVLEKNTPSAS